MEICQMTALWRVTLDRYIHLQIQTFMVFDDEIDILIAFANAFIDVFEAIEQL